MNSSSNATRKVRSVPALLALSAAMMAIPGMAQAQSGKWVGTMSSIQGGGAADITVEPRNEKQSRVKLVFRNTKRDARLNWDVVAGICSREGQPIAPQASFTLVQTSMDGSGTVSSNVPKLESGKEYYVRVFDPQSQPTDASAMGCANLSEKK
jgi:hypothetical protein